MNLDDINAISWQDDGVSVPFESFQEFALRKGFKYVFTFPVGGEPRAAIAARTIDELTKHVRAIQQITD